MNCHPTLPQKPIPPPKTWQNRSLHGTMHSCTFPCKEVFRDLEGVFFGGGKGGVATYENPGFPVPKPGVSQSQASGGCHKSGFPKAWFWRMFPGTKTGTRVHSSDVPPEQKPERGYVRMFPQNENRNEGTFAKTTLLRNCPFVSR